jgi:hypothetical protein
VEIQVMPLDREDNAGVDGPFTVITRKGVRGVSLAAARYGIIRSQALTPRESMEFVEKLLGEL